MMASRVPPKPEPRMTRSTECSLCECECECECMVATLFFLALTLTLHTVKDSFDEAGRCELSGSVHRATPCQYPIGPGIRGRPAATGRIPGPLPAFRAMAARTGRYLLVLPSRRCRRASGSSCSIPRRPRMRSRASASAHSSPSTSERNGGRTMMNARTAMPASRSAPRGLREIVERHLLIESREHVRVHGFEPHGDFELWGRAGDVSPLFRAANRGLTSPARQHVVELEAAAADQPRMALHDQSLEWRRQLRDCRVFLRGDRPQIEKASRVVELQVMSVPVGSRLTNCPSAQRICSAI